MNETLHNVAWECTSCGELTYHPDADMEAKIEIRLGTTCLKCIKKELLNGQVRLRE